MTLSSAVDEKCIELDVEDLEASPLAGHPEVPNTSGESASRSDEHLLPKLANKAIWLGFYERFALFVDAVAGPPEARLRTTQV